MHTNNTYRVKVTRIVYQKHLQSKFILFEIHVDMNNMLQPQFKRCAILRMDYQICSLFECRWQRQRFGIILFAMHSEHVLRDIYKKGTSHLTICHVCMLFQRINMYYIFEWSKIVCLKFYNS